MSRILYRLIAMAGRLAVRSGWSKDLEIVVVSHQHAVRGRPIARPTITATASVAVVFFAVASKPTHPDLTS